MLKERYCFLKNENRFFYATNCLQLEWVKPIGIVEIKDKTPQFLVDWSVSEDRLKIDWCRYFASQAVTQIYTCKSPLTHLWMLAGGPIPGGPGDAWANIVDFWPSVATGADLCELLLAGCNHFANKTYKTAVLQTLHFLDRHYISIPLPCDSHSHL